MRRMTDARVGGAIAIVLGPLGWCVAFGALLGGDPMIAFEIGGSALVLLWAALLVREVLASRGVAQGLLVGSEPGVFSGVACRVTPALAMDAVVVGSLRPQVFVGAELVEGLTDRELEAVMFHEDHHRRTRAPLRAAALGAWLRILGRSNHLRAVLLGRLTALETMADADAIRRGSTPRSLAAALLKGGPSINPVAFTYGTQLRVERLLERAAGIPERSPAAPPYEWLPVAFVAISSLICHASL